MTRGPATRKGPRRTAGSLCVPAFAKINLALEVLGVRQDGYHELRTLFQTIDLHDEITLVPRRRDIRLACRHPDVPTGPENLAWRAAEELRRRGGVQQGVEIRIEKRIPVAGGLGGGSSDAASVLLGLDRLWGLGLGPEGLLPLARRLGADVPYFLFGGTALGLARGDEIYPLLQQVRGHVVVVDPGRPLGTAAVFARHDARLTPRENSYTIQRFVASALSGFVSLGGLSNELETAALEEAPDLVPRVGRIRAVLEREGAVLASLTGSGSAVFGLFGRRGGAARAQLALSREGLKAHLARTLTAQEYRRTWVASLGGRERSAGRNTR